VKKTPPFLYKRAQTKTKGQMEFPIRLPNPDSLAQRLFPPTQHLFPIVRSAVPPVLVRTIPGLFADGGEFNPIEDIRFLHMEDMLNLQALFAAGQFLSARCKEHGLQGISDPNPFVGKTFACLYSELSLLGATLSAVMGEIVMGVRLKQAQSAYSDFTADMDGYAPWLKFPDGASSLWELIRKAQNKLKEVDNLISTYRDAKEHFEKNEPSV
jgi:hypothetical protein